MTAFWDIAQCSHFVLYRQFSGAECNHHQGAVPRRAVVFILAPVRTLNLTKQAVLDCNDSKI
jgi:hypothetical protein